MKKLYKELGLFSITCAFSIFALGGTDGPAARKFSESPAGTTRTSCDNSEGLPPVGDQVVAGSCYAWAAAYYYLTHLQWQEYGWDVTDPAHQCSPAFVYNLTNGGVDNGASSGEHARRDAFKVFETLGCATMADMPYTYYGYQNFPSEVAFRNGMRFRTFETHFIDTSTPDGIRDLKDHLLEGHLAVLGILGYGNLNEINLYNNTYCVSQTYGGRLYWHEVTVVGFDDSLTTADGVGAFRLVNSWGTGWGDRGFFWMSYEAVMDPKTASGYAMYATDRIGYEPTLTARIEVEHRDRYNLIYKTGIGQIESPDTLLTFFDFNPMSLMIGVSYTEGAIVLDVSDMAPFFENDPSKEFFINIVDRGVGNGFSGMMVFCAIEDLARDLSAPSADTPVLIFDTYEAATATVVFDNSYAPPVRLAAELDTLTGDVFLIWDAPDSLDSFITFRMYRDGELIDSTVSTTYMDRLNRHGYHQYAVSALYEGGESLHTINEIFWPFPFGIPYIDDFEYSIGGWEQWGTSGYEGIIVDDPVYDGEFCLGLQTHLEDSNILGRFFEEMEGADVEVWFNMASYPVSSGGVGGCAAFITPNGENLGVFVAHNGNPAYIEVLNTGQVDIEVLDSTVVLELDTWYKHKMRYRNGKLYAMIMDEVGNVLLNNIVYVRDYRINMVVLAAIGLDLGWNYFDAFSIRQWDGYRVDYFTTVNPTGKPYALIVTEATLGDSMLMEGDEIAVFDGDLCVGAAIVDGDWPLEINAWGQDGGRSGFSAGNEMSFRVWHEQSNSEFGADVTYEVGEGTFGEGIFSRLSLVGREEVSVEDNEPTLPLFYTMSPAYPNPFNSSTRLNILLPEAGHVEIAVYNIIGQRVAVLAGDRFEEGYHRFTFDASNLSSGIYFIRATVSGRWDIMRKVVLLK